MCAKHGPVRECLLEEDVIGSPRLMPAVDAAELLDLAPGGRLHEAGLTAWRESS